LKDRINKIVEIAKLNMVDQGTIAWATYYPEIEKLFPLLEEISQFMLGYATLTGIFKLDNNGKVFARTLTWSWNSYLGYDNIDRTKINFALSIQLTRESSGSNWQIDVIAEVLAPDIPILKDYSKCGKMTIYFTEKDEISLEEMLKRILSFMNNIKDMVSHGKA